MFVVGEGAVQVQFDLAGGRLIVSLVSVQQFLVAVGGLQVLDAAANQLFLDSRSVFAGYVGSQQLFEFGRGRQFVQRSLAFSLRSFYSFVGQQVVGVDFQRLDFGQQFQVFYFVVGYSQEVVFVIFVVGKSLRQRYFVRFVFRRGWISGKVFVLFLLWVIYGFGRLFQFFKFQFVYLYNRYRNFYFVLGRFRRFFDVSCQGFGRVWDIGVQKGYYFFYFVLG